MERILKKTYRTAHPLLWMLLGVGICIFAACGLEMFYTRLFPHIVNEKQIL